MNWWRRLIGRRTLERQLDAELADHLERQTADFVRAGLSRAEAERRARVLFGGSEPVKEACRDARGTRWLEDFAGDVRYAVRHLRKHPIFTLVAAASLGLGIGAAAGIFSLVDAVLLKTLPVRAPDELVLLSERTGLRQNLSWSVDQFRSFQQSDSLTGVCAFRPRADFSITTAGESEIASGQLVSGNCFDVLGLRAQRGRLLTDDDERAGDAQPVAVIGDRFWRHHFGGDPNVVGRTLELKGHTVTVVGVTPRDFLSLEAGKEIDISVPLSLQPWAMPGNLMSSPKVRWLRLIGRRHSDVSFDRAQADLATRWQTVVAPRTGADASQFELLRGAQGLNELRDQFSLALRLLMAAVVVLLLMACANLASLVLARARARAHEVTLRLALGAGRGRIVRQLLTESLVLSSIGGAAGLALAYSGSHAIVALMSRGRSAILIDISIDLRLVCFTLAVTILTSLVFGLWPALAATRANLQPRLQAGTRTVAGADRFRSNVLIAAQAGLSIVLVVSAVLFAQSLARLYGVDIRSNKHQVLLVTVRPGVAKGESVRVVRIFQDLYARFSEMSGVRSVTQSMDLPFSGWSYRASVSVPGEPSGGDESTNFNFVGPRFLETMGIPLLAGRDVQATDDAQSVAVGVISQSIAARYFPGRNAIGEHLRTDQGLVEVVGIAKDIPYEGVRTEKEMVLYRPYLQSGQAGAASTFAIRADLPAGALADLVKRALRDVAPGVPIVSMISLDDQFDAQIATERLLADIAGFFGVMALLLVAIGVYGTLAASVVTRAREIGIRLALGAGRRQIATMVLTGALGPVLLGVVIGGPLAFLGVRLARATLFGITPRDPATYISSAVLLVLVATTAAAMPARAAARADPIRSLREE